jgi:hypothetical protein
VLTYMYFFFNRLIGYIFKMAAQHPKLASDSLEKIPDNIAVSSLPDFESLSKKALEKELYRYSTILKVCHRRFRHEGCVDLDFFSLTANILHPYVWLHVLPKF